MKRTRKGVHKVDRVELDACLNKLVIRKEEKTEGMPQGRHGCMLMKVSIKKAKKNGREYARSKSKFFSLRS